MITIHLEYLTLFASVVFFTLYSWYLYPEEFNRRVMKCMTALCCIFITITLLFPPRIFTLLINPFLVSLFFFIAYSFFVYIRAAQNKRIGAKYSLLSTAIGFILAIAINLEYFRITNPPREWVFLGYILFFFLQSLILSFRFAFILNRAKLEAEEGLRVKSEFLSTMSHEIRTPLNSVIGLSHLLLKNDPRADQKENLDVLLYSANHLLNIVNDILDYNKIEAGKIKFEQIEMDITGIIQNIIKGLKTFADNKGIELKMEKAPVLHKRLTGDPTRLGQVLNNLLHNAIKFTKEGSVVVEIKIGHQTEKEVTLTIFVKDTGIGIEPDKQRMIFDRFSQADSSVSRNFGGTGLGLAICKKLLNLQGSELQLTSEQGKGSVFYFTQTFPVSTGAQTEQAEPATLPAEETKPLRGIIILLVEDNELNILVAKSLLERWGGTVDIARNGQEAVDMLDIHRHKMVLMDMHMPVMDGYTATRRMREMEITLPIVALTASLPQEVEEEAKRLGMNDIIVKPFVPDELYRKVLHYAFISKETENGEENT
jgi:signal transduction histidine kinase/CheY-like chemotaxis protein